MTQYFADGELIAGCRVSQWNVVRLRRVGKQYVVTRNETEHLGTYEKLERGVDAFERATHGVANPAAAGR
jgi:hypothetical protein